VRHLAVSERPGSGTSDELLDAAHISARHIAAAARSLAA
jgi:transketolase